MSRSLWFLVPVVCWWLVQPAHAVPFVPDFSEGPVVFDFEDGLQGWAAEGSVQRVQTQVLGGEWAILADGLLASPSWSNRIPSLPT